MSFYTTQQIPVPIRGKANRTEIEAELTDMGQISLHKPIKKQLST